METALGLLEPFLGSLGWIALEVLLLVLVLPSIQTIGPTQVGLLTKRFSFKKLKDGNVIAFNGAAGYQERLLMPGWRFVFWPLYICTKYPWVQVPVGQVGVVISQVGDTLPVGAKSAVYKEVFGDFRDLRAFIENGGQKGVQRPVLSPGATVPMHPIAFLVITQNQVYGHPMQPELEDAYRRRTLSCSDFGLDPSQLNVVRIEPTLTGSGVIQDMVGIVTTLEGPPLDEGDIACRLGGYVDLTELELDSTVPDTQIIERLFASKNDLHGSYQNFQAFLDAGGKMGLQHDPILYGAYTLNPFLVNVQLVPMLVVQQGQVAVIKSYVGLETKDTSGTEFKFGSLVRPGHRGIWQEPLRTGKYPLNPRIYAAEMVPTAILTLSWADYSSKAHDLDRELESIIAKSREGFVYKLDLQVLIHIADTMASRVISMVGTMRNLVDEVLQSAVGNHFRNRVQSMPAVQFIENRQSVQVEAAEHIVQQLAQYYVEVRGVYIQDVNLPDALVAVLTQREIAHQDIETFNMQRQAEEGRIQKEQAKGQADKQGELAASVVNIQIKQNDAQARTAEAKGEATYISETGAAKAVEVRATGVARAEAYRLQVEALGQGPTAWVNAINALAEHNVKIMPEVLVAGGGDAFSALAASFVQKLRAEQNPPGSPESASPAGAVIDDQESTAQP